MLEEINDLPDVWTMPDLREGGGPTATLGLSEDQLAVLDPTRDYGDRTFDDIQQAVRDGRLLLSPGHPVPVIRDAVTRQIVAGSGSAGLPNQRLLALRNEHAGAGRAWFERRLLGGAPELLDGRKTDRDEIYDRAMMLISVGGKGAAELMVFFLRQHIGREPEGRVGMGAQMVEAIMRQLGTGVEARVRAVE